MTLRTSEPSPLVPGFKPKRLHAYRVPVRLKPKVDRQIQDMLDNGIIRPSCSPMASPLVCVLKGKEGCNGVRLAVDCRYVNRFTCDDAYLLPDISSVFQRTGRCNLITVVDCKAGYLQIPMLEEDKWLTALVCDAGLFEFNGAPFGLKGSGNTFVRAMNIILSSVCIFTGSFVDNVAVHSHQGKEHVNHLDRFLAVVKKHGLTLSLKKCRFAQSRFRFCGEIIGSRKRFTDPEKLPVLVLQEMKPSTTKTEVKRILDFFFNFREDTLMTLEMWPDHLLTRHQRSTQERFLGELQQHSFEELKHLLCKATVEPLYIVDFAKPFNLFVDTSLHTVSAVLT